MLYEALCLALWLVFKTVLKVNHNEGKDNLSAERIFEWSAHVELWRVDRMSLGTAFFSGEAALRLLTALLLSWSAMWTIQ